MVGGCSEGGVRVFLGRGWNMEKDLAQEGAGIDSSSARQIVPPPTPQALQLYTGAWMSAS